MAASTSTLHTYDLVSTRGVVYNRGGAGWYGDLRHRSFAGEIVGLSVSPGGHGYWLAGSTGSVFPFGNAKWVGSLGKAHLLWRQEIISIHSTLDGKGYWLLGRNGSIRRFGDAAVIARRAGQSPLGLRPFVGGAVTPSGHGAWFTNAKGDIFAVGAATNYGSLRGKSLSAPITAIADTPDGRGYWLTDAKGHVFGFGDATNEPLDWSAPGPFVGIAAAASQHGYWAATIGGTVVPGGLAVRINSLLTGETRIAAIVSAPSVAPAPGFVAPGSVGFDVNWPQCAPIGSSNAGSLPALSGRSVAVVGVDGWARDSYNSCLGAETAWARHGTSPYELYMFLNSPGSSTSGDQTGPGGTCSAKTGAAWQRCLAFNYGYNAAKDAVSHAAAAGAHSSMWWIDVENGACAPGQWSRPSQGEWWSCDLWLNAVTVQGAIDGLRAARVTAGIYCTSLQWAEITNNYVVPGAAIPLWVAGAYWTSPPYPANYGYPSASANAGFCDGHYDFGGGKAVLLQETPGSNGYPFDPDLAC